MSRRRAHTRPQYRRRAHVEADIELEVLVEEDSAALAVQRILSRLFQNTRIRVGVRQFQGKPDLLKKLPDRLAGYARARSRGLDVRVAVLVDRDTDDCVALKKRLDRIADGAGLVPRLHARAPGQFQVLNRIAVRELESWYFGDWPAVRKAFPKAPTDAPRKYRHHPDGAPGKASDTFEKMLRTSGVRVVSEPEWARRIAPHMSLETNASSSFRAFLTGIADLVERDGQAH